jgi:repressor LexA
MRVMASLPTTRQQQIAAFIHSEFRKRGSAPTQREIAERFGFASLNSVRSHLRLMEKKGMLDRLPGKARGLKLKHRSPVGIPLVGHIAAGNPRLAFQDCDEIVPVSSELFVGSELFAVRVRGESMKDAGILPGDIAVVNRQSEVADGEIAVVLLGEEATLKYVYRQNGTVLLRGANAAFPDIVVRTDGQSPVLILGKYVGLIRNQRSPR